MRWLIYAGVMIVILVAVIVAVGYALPKAHLATRHARYSQTPEAVYAR